MTPHAQLQPGRRLLRRARCSATRSRSCTTPTALDDEQMQRFAQLDQPVRDDVPARAHRRRGRLPAADLHAERRAAVRRPPDPGQRARLAGGRGSAARRGRAGAGVRRRAGRGCARRRPAGVRRRRRCCAPGRCRDEDRDRIVPGAADRRATRSSTASGSTTARAGSACCWRTPRRCWRSQPGLVGVRRAGHRRRRPLPGRRRATPCRGPRLLPGDGDREDPVTGSLNAGIGQWLAGDRLPDVVRRVAGHRARPRAAGCTSSGEGSTVWVGGDTAHHGPREAVGSAT